MIVVDASAALELLLRGPAAAVVEARLLALGEALHAPHLIDLEVAQVLRRHVLAGYVSSDQASVALAVWQAFPVSRHGHDLLIDHIWALRTTLTAYDAAYVALAEALDAPLITTDAKLSGAPGHRARIEMIA